ncbi:glutamate ABC transporter substrate-binding protein [Nocardia sp. 2]|uniref:Glutamate ABC transporter substrate-binding protein n=1 Tax=Nocardia acididurans TaxID=2802282 RepID=A0ABS1MCZ7_9NOCA|nr:glutamate ABC transporter substrate-binding protein [Nocardia acididurans]MBL1078522.1 glutamate ABC transporter substrate-binding protein [Nocardia acididurans]
MTRAILAATLAAGLAMTAACGSDDERVPNVATGDRSLTIGIKFDQPGLSVMQDSGLPKGFDADTARYIADKLHVKPEKITWKQTPTDQREKMLTAGAVDFIVASYSITADRMRQVSFAGPYLVAGQDLLVRTDENGITRAEDLDGRTVCSAEGSTSADTIRKDFSPGANLTTRENYSACVDDLLAGRVDAVSTDDVILAGYAAQHPDRLRVVGRPFTRERYGVGVKKGNTELQGQITSALQEMIADGSWQRSMTVNLTPSGYRPMPAPAVFNAPDKQVAAGNITELDPELVRAVDQVADLANKQDWEAFSRLTCAETTDAIDRFLMQYTPQYDENLGAEAKDTTFTFTINGISQVGPDTATFLARETFSKVPDKYKQYFKDIDYTGTMNRRDGEWKLCALAADFVEP